MSISRFGIAFGTMKLRDKLLLLTAVIFIGFAVSIVMGILVINKVRIGSGAYQEIKNNQQGLERIALLGSSLNRFRVMTGALISEQGSDRRGQIERTVADLRSDIDAKFAELEATAGKGDSASAIADARETWSEFFRAVETGRRRLSWSRPSRNSAISVSSSRSMDWWQRSPCRWRRLKSGSAR